MDDSSARIDRLWGGVSARLARPRFLFRWVWAGAAVCALAGAVLFLGAGGLRSGRRPSPSWTWEGTHLETVTEASSVRLVDGSRLTLDPHSMLEVGERTSSAVRLELVRGRLACDVTHRPGRSFRVVAGGVEVRVVGTRFSVASPGSGTIARVSVEVERGVVEVRGHGGAGEPIRVEAGHTWTQPAEPPPSSASAPVAVAAGASAEPSSGPARAEAVSPAMSSARPAAPRTLFEQARRAWRAGHIEQAAQTYQDLLSSYPRDPRAGLAAFELGRLRMDRLSDPSGAVAALERAVVLAPGAQFREDAMARLVAADAAARQGTACRRARDQYLREYPAGVHRRTVAAACAAP